MRIAGITLPDNKQLAYALPCIYGIGEVRARKILQEVEIDPLKKTADLSTEEEQKIRTVAEKYVIEGELRRQISQNVRRLKDIRCGRGIRHERRLPVRGGRTKTNSRTVRGNLRRTMGSGRRSLEKT